MTNEYIHRHIESRIQHAAESFPSITVMGPRSAGKTTTLRRLFGDSYRYVSLALPHNRIAANSDARQFLANNPPPVFFDEIEYAPDLLFYVKGMIDEDRFEKNRSLGRRFLITWSRDMRLFEGRIESLAGRTAIFWLLPLSSSELHHDSDVAFPWERDQNELRKSDLQHDVWKLIWQGGYPGLNIAPKHNWAEWHGNHIQSFLERDARSFRRVNDLDKFESFMRVLALQSGQLLNLAELAGQLGITTHLAKHWLRVLEECLLVFPVRSFYQSEGKRQVTSPRIYFTDTGTLCYLTDQMDPGTAANGLMANAIFESAVVLEIIKRLQNRGQLPSVYFWETFEGHRVSLIVQEGARLVPVEIKRHYDEEYKSVENIQSLTEVFPNRIKQGYIVHPDTAPAFLTQTIMSIPFSAL